MPATSASASRHAVVVSSRRRRRAASALALANCVSGGATGVDEEPLFFVELVSVLWERFEDGFEARATVELSVRPTGLVPGPCRRGEVL